MVKQDLTKEELLERYRELPLGNISDAMDMLGLQRRVMHGLYPISPTQPRTVGWAFTLKQIQRHPNSGKEKVLTKHAEIVDHLAKPNDVLVIDVGGRMDIATGGAFVAKCAQLRGLNGFVIDGCFRDISDILPTNFPIHIKGVSPIKSSPELESIEVNMPVCICGVQIRPGDLIVADDSGVIAISPENVNEVYWLAAAIKEKESYLEKMLDDGMDLFSAVERAESMVPYLKDYSS